MLRAAVLAGAWRAGRLARPPVPGLPSSRPGLGMVGEADMGAREATLGFRADALPRLLWSAPCPSVSGVSGDTMAPLRPASSCTYSPPGESSSSSCMHPASLMQVK